MNKTNKAGVDYTMNFSDVVQLIRRSNGMKIGYAEAAKILDRAIAPQIAEAERVARYHFAKQLYDLPQPWSENATTMLSNEITEYEKERQ